VKAEKGRREAILVRWVAPGLLLAIMATLLVVSSLGKRLVYDEYDNLAYGHRLLSRGLAPPTSGQRMPILMLNALPCAAAGCRARDLEADETARLLVRIPTMIFALMLAVVGYGWASEMFGPRPGLLALGLLAFDPTLLAHGKQVTSDVATAFFSLFALWAFWRLLRGRGGQIANLLACALGTAGALVSKYTSVLLFVAFGLLLAIESLAHRQRAGRFDRARLGHRARQSAAFVAIVLVLVNAAYLFQGTFTRADAYDWKGQSLQFLRSVPVPIPLPRVFVLGLDRSSQIQEERGTIRGYNYVLGRLNVHGTWYAFPLMVLLKTPLALFGLLALAVRRPRGLVAESPSDGVLLLLPFALVLAFFSLLAEPQLGIRYLLPGLPLLALYASASVAGSPTRRVWYVALALAAWFAGSSLSYTPHPMSYFNELIGWRIDAWRYLADSNLDWEDRTRDIDRYQAAHPERPLVVSPRAPEAGWVLVAANDLVGIRDPERYRWLREHFAPVEQVGYSYLLFQVPPERLHEILATPPVRSDAEPAP
jgi:Dolichyl-phosphate-mannose-protein mannosyltransferase